MSFMAKINYSSPLSNPLSMSSQYFQDSEIQHDISSFLDKYFTTQNCALMETNKILFTALFQNKFGTKTFTFKVINNV